MKDLVKNWKIIGIVMLVVFCMGVGCLFYFKDGGDKFKGIESFSEENINQNFSSDDLSKISSTGDKNDVNEGNSKDVNGATEEIYVHIVGEVNNQGVIILSKGQRIVDAIEKAGGVTELADLSKVNLAYVLSDGQKVRIPSVYDEGNSNEEFATADGGNNVIESGGVGSVRKVNINTATQTELETITGIGPSLAAKIISYREKNGKFKSVDELKNVSGIGDAKFEGLKDFVEV